MKSKFTKLLALMTGFLALTVTSCKDNNEEHKVYDNEKNPLVFASQELDGVFNPFYYTAAPDAQIIGMTQISMFTTDKNAKIAYGKDQPVVVLDYEQKRDEIKDTTTYTFVLKNPSFNVKFSNGSYLTLKDVLFNMYEYLDPAYTGSSTMYSTDIVGLKQYRTQQESESGQDAFEEKFATEANERVDQLVTVIAEIVDENGSGIDYNVEQLKEKLAEKETQYKGNSEFKYAEKFVEDFEYVGETFKKELESDFEANRDTYEDYGLDSDVEAFLYAEGLITIDLSKDKDDPERIDYALGKDTTKDWTKEKAIDEVYKYYYPDQFSTIVNYWASATTIRSQFISEAKDEYFKNNEMIFKNISGIKVITEDTVVNGTSYAYAQYDGNGMKTAGSEGGYEMFSITINGVDPKAIWNFSFSVAPMYYYSNEEQIALFDYNEHFGVEYGSTTFQTNVIKDPEKVGLPVGAGAYQVSDKNSNITGVKDSDFFDQNVVYFHRNDNFLMGKPKIRLMRYQVTSTNQMLNALFQGQVHYCEPSAKQEIINELNEASDEGFSYAQARTLGYGYIGINAKAIPSVYSRRAIMYSMDTSLTLNYYPGTAEIIYRPMSKVSWAYPTDAEAYYPFDMTGNKSKEMLKLAGYTQNSKGLMVDKNGKQFKYTFTISGDTTDHPSYQTLLKSQQILNSIGCDITVRTDVDALKKLSTGSLDVWAAAWSSTIDPDMYQVYHKDSTASSTLNWGYDVILKDVSGKYTYEQGVINELSDKIDAGRETLDQDKRTKIYSECLDLVMDLAVEMPTYQRNDLFAFNSSYIDRSTMTPDSEISPYNGLINQIWNLSLVTE